MSEDGAVTAKEDRAENLVRNRSLWYESFVLLATCVRYLFAWVIPFAVAGFFPLRSARSLGVWLAMRAPERLISGAVVSNDSNSFWLVQSAACYRFGQGRFIRGAVLIGILLAWPAIHLLRSVRNTRRHSRKVAMETGLSASRQFVQQLELGYRFPVLFIMATEISEIGSDWYYRRELYRKDRRARLAASLPSLATVFWLANVWRRRETCAATQGSKKTFWHEKLVEGGVATIPILATVKGSNVKLLVGLDSERWEGDLFAKPDDGMRGNGAMRFRYSTTDRYETRDGLSVTRGEIFDMLAETQTDYVVQPCVKNHHTISEIVGGDVLTATRVYTTLGADGVPKIIPIAIFKLPRYDADTDNVHQGALPCSVNPKAGMLLSVYCQDLTRIFVNPYNGISIKNFRLPFWKESLDLVLKAHGQVSDIHKAVGWDVAASENGPLIVEGNTTPDSLEYLDDDLMHGEIPEVSEVFDYLARASYGN